MRKMISYFYIQFRRACRLLPAQLVMTLLGFVCLGFLAVSYLNNSIWAQERTKLKVAVVGDTSESYLGFGIQAIRVIDDSRFMIELPDMTETEAKKGLIHGDISGYIKVPEGLVESIVTGANDRKLILVTSEGQKGIIGSLAQEMSKVVSTLLTCSQSAIYGMQTILMDEKGSGSLWEATDIMNLRYLDMVVNRADLYELDILGISNGLSTKGYYLCGILIFFLQLSGIDHSPYFTRRKKESAALLASKGVGPFKQILGEYLACVFLNLCCLLEIMLFLGIVMQRGLFRIDEWEKMGMDALTGFSAGLLPVAAMLAAMQLLLYELTTGVVSGIMIQFVSSIAMGYLAGCFYPANLFPDTLKHLGAVLPTGVAMRYANGIMKGGPRIADCAGIILYMFSFLGIAVLVRKYRLQKG